MSSISKICSFTLLTIIVVILSSCSKNSEPDPEEWKIIFNGKSLDGWTAKFTGSEVGENYKNTFQISDGTLRVSYNEYDSFRYEFGHLFYKEKLSYYRVRLDYRFTGQPLPGAPEWAYANNGLMLHAQSAESMSINQAFPLSIEYQFLAERPTGGLCTPGCHVSLNGKLYEPHCLEEYNGPIHKLDEWASAEAVVLGDSIIHHILNGDTILTYTNPIIGGGMVGLDSTKFPEGKRMTEGYFALQAESFQTEFRNIELLNLCGCTDSKAKNYKSYYLKSDNSTCVY